MGVNKSRLLIVILGAMSCLLLVTMAWAAPHATESVAPLQSTPGFDADKLDGHHAVASTSLASQRRWKLLWADGNGQLSWGAMPQTALNNHYLRRDQTSLLAVNPLEIVTTSEIAGNVGLQFLYHWNGYTEIWNDTHTQGTIYIPIDNFTTVYGSALKLSSIDVCYQVASGSYIYRTGVYYADSTGNRTQLLWDETSQASTTWTCYNVTNYTPTPIEGPLLVYFNLMFGGTGNSYKITIGQITLTLTE